LYQSAASRLSTPKECARRSNRIRLLTITRVIAIPNTSFLSSKRLLQKDRSRPAGLCQRLMNLFAYVSKGRTPASLGSQRQEQQRRGDPSPGPSRTSRRGGSQGQINDVGSGVTPGGTGGATSSKTPPSGGPASAPSGVGPRGRRSAGARRPRCRCRRRERQRQRRRRPPARRGPSRSTTRAARRSSPGLSVDQD